MMALPDKLLKFANKSNTLLSVILRFNSTLSRRLIYDNYGEPSSVIRLEELPLKSPENSSVLVKLLAAPVNPADINTIQGVYPVKPPLPSVPGNEGVGEIVEVGPKVKGLKVGDWVIPRENAWGTWRTHAVCPEFQLQKIIRGLDIAAAATISVNPCTAYRMLKDFEDLEPNDVVIQNGANSACGQCVIQLCQEWGYQTINIVRNRSDIEELKTKLKNLGATYVVTEEEVPTLALFKKGVKKPKLALNCIGGKNCLNMMRHLEKKGTLVTYGGMSREPVTVPTSALIFKDIAVRGYWMTEWNNANAGSSEHVVMLSEVAKLSKAGRLVPPAHQFFPLSEYKQVLSQAMNISGKTGVKCIFNLNE